MTDTDRVKLTAPQEEPVFSSQYQLGVQEINLANHLANDKFLALSEEVFQRYMLSLGFSGGLLFDTPSMIAAVQIQFLAQGMYGDLLDMNLWLVSRSQKGFRVFVQFKRGTEELGRIQLDRVFVDTATQRACPCPQGFIDYFDKL